jgi:hypothetical protein
MVYSFVLQNYYTNSFSSFNAGCQSPYYKTVAYVMCLSFCPDLEVWVTNYIVPESLTDLLK